MITSRVRPGRCLMCLNTTSAFISSLLIPEAITSTPTPRLSSPPSSCPASSSALSPRTPRPLAQQQQQQQQRRQFSSTPCRERISTQRRTMYAWLENHGRRFVGPQEVPSNYLGLLDNQPFPLNPLFRSEPVLDDEARELIWTQVIKNGESLKAVSAALNVDVRRVAAVVRMKQMERQFEEEKKPMAKPYAKAVLKMLPKQSFSLTDPSQNYPFEPISEVHAHTLTAQQLFVPTHESYQFTRKDAALAFHASMLPADKRIAHPELVQLEKDLAAGKGQKESTEKFKTTAKQSEEKLTAKRQSREDVEKARITHVDSSRFEFRFRNVSVEDVGRDGKSVKGAGWRYGAPLLDRKKGRVKIPTQVPMPQVLG